MMFFLKSIIIGANPLNICMFGNMTLFAKASYTIITAKQFVLVCKRLSLRGEKMLPSIPKQIVLLLQILSLRLCKRLFEAVSGIYYPKESCRK